MKKLILSAALALGFTGAGFAQDAVEGIWQTEVDDGAFAYVTIAPCGSAFCGVISRTFNAEGEYASENIGRQLVWDMQAANGGKYKSGQIWQPSTDKIFKSKMTLSGDVLIVKGCVLGGVVCDGQTWNRVN